MSDFTCNYCGKSGARRSSYDPTPAGWVWNKTYGFGKKLYCSNKCKNDGEGVGSSSNNNQSTQSSEPVISKTPEQIEAEARAQAIEDQQSLERRKYEEELAAKKREERNRRADELRKQGKNFQAFCVEFQNLLIGVLIGLIFVVGGIIVVTNDSNNQEEAIAINTQLELREDSIKLFILNKEFDKALELTQKLIHPMHEEYKAKTELFAKYYDDYWSEKRDFYKDLIFNKGEVVKEADSEEESEDQVQDESYTTEEENYVLPENQQYEDQYVDSSNF